MPVRIKDDEYDDLYASATPFGGDNSRAGWGQKFGAAVDSAQAGLYGVGEALGSDWAGEQRRRNQVDAETNKRLADENLGVPQTWGEARGLGGVGKYVAGLAVDSAPQMAATIGAGMVGGLPAAGAVGYGFALGDTLSNQREAGGRTDLLTAGAAAVPYAAADVLLGGEARVLRGVGAKGFGREALDEIPESINLIGRAERAADKVGGIKGYPLRAGIQFGKTGAEEAVSETFQETMNQAARMGVDPNTGMFDPDALERYKESAIGGGLLGGTIGGGMSMGRRTRAAQPEAHKPIGIGWNGQSTLGDKADPGASGTRVSLRLGWNGQTEDQGLPGDSLGPQARQAVGAAFPVPDAPQAPTPPTPEEQARQDSVAAVQQRVGAIQERDQRAQEYGLKGTAAFDTFGQLMQALDGGRITQDEFDEQVANLAANRRGVTQKFLKELAQPTPEQIGQKRADRLSAATGAAMPLATTPEQAAQRRRERLAAAIDEIHGPQAQPLNTSPEQAAGRREQRLSGAIEGIEGVPRNAPPDYTAEGAQATREGRQGRLRGDVMPLNVTPEGAAARRQGRLDEATGAQRPADVTQDEASARRADRLARARQELYGQSASPLNVSPERAAGQRRQRISKAIEEIEGVTRTDARDYTAEGAQATREGRQGRHRGDALPVGTTPAQAAKKRAERVAAAIGEIEGNSDMPPDMTPEEIAQRRRQRLATAMGAKTPEGGTSEQAAARRRARIVAAMADIDGVDDVKPGMTPEQIAARRHERLAAAAAEVERNATPKPTAPLKPAPKPPRVPPLKPAPKPPVTAEKREADIAKAKVEVAKEAPKPKAAPVQEKSPGLTYVEALEKREGKTMPERTRNRLFLRLGFDLSGHPVASPRTNEEVAIAETELARKAGQTRYKVATKAAIDKDLKGWGIRDSDIQAFSDFMARRGVDMKGVDEAEALLNPGEEAEVNDDGSPLQAEEREMKPEGDMSVEEVLEAAAKAEEEAKSKTDEDEGGDKAATEFGSGMSEQERPDAAVTKNETAVWRQHQKMLRQLAKSSEFTEEQRAQFQRVATIADNKEREAEIKKLIGSKLFGNKKAQLAPLFEHGKTTKTATKKKAVVEGALEAEEEVDPQLAARNAAQIARNAADKAAREEEQRIAAEQAGDEMTRLLMEVRDADQTDVQTAEAEWGNRTAPDEPQWTDLNLEEKASWVRAVMNNPPGRLTDIAGKKVGEAQTRMEAAARRQAERERRVQEALDAKDAQGAGALAEGEGTGQEEAAAGSAPPGVDETGEAADVLNRITAGGVAASNPPAGGRASRGMKRLLALFRARQISPEAMATRAEIERRMSVADKMDAQEKAAFARDNRRGPDAVIAELDAAMKAGSIPREMGQMAKWFLQKNPQLFRELRVHLREATAQERGVAGSYDPVQRIVTLITNEERAPTDTAVHELLHHLERLMPPDMQAGLRRQWARRMNNASVDAAQTGDADLINYFKNLHDYHYGGDRVALQRAQRLVVDGKVSLDNYQFFSPSEFWAINASRILEGQYNVPQGVLAKIKQWLKEFAQKAASVIGANSDGTILRALGSLSESNGDWTTGTTLASVPGSHFMYAGLKSADQEKLMQQQKAEWMKQGGATNEEIRASTGWFVGLDGRWRYEIADQNASFSTPYRSLKETGMLSKKENYTIYKLGDILDHPELFAAYPAARDVEVVRQSFFGGGLNGSYDGGNRIQMNPYLMEEQALSTLLHEAQHWVQKQQGWARGGNTEQVILDMSEKQYERFKTRLAAELDTQIERDRDSASMMKKAVNWPRLQEFFDARKAHAAASRALAQYEEANDAQNARWFGKMTAEHKALEATYKETTAAFDALRDEMRAVTGLNHSDLLANFNMNRMLEKDTVAEATAYFGERAQALSDAIERAQEVPTATREHMKVLAKGSETVMSAYRAIAGEMEARDVQARIEMSDAERRATQPMTSESVKDIPREDIIRVMTSSWTADAQPMLNIFASPAERSKSFTETVKKTTARLPPAQARWARATAHSTKGAVNTLVRALTFTEDLARQALAGMPSVSRYMSAMQRSNMMRRTREQRVAMLRDSFMQVSKGERAAVNAYLKASTMEGKWGYEPDDMELDEDLEIDPTLAKQFDALSAAGQQIVRDVFYHGRDSLMSMKKAVQDSVNAQYDQSIALFEAAGDTQGADKARAKKQEALDDYSRLMAMNADRPYAPLKRFGDFVVVGKSQAYMDAERMGDTKMVRALQSNPQHYYVAMRETRGEAAVHADEIAGQYDNADHFKKDDAYSAFGTASMMAGFSRMSSMLARSNPAANAASQAALHRLMTDMYYSLLAEGSARQAERRRIGVAGADEDMMRSFVTKAKADANFISLLESNGDAQDAMDAMREESQRDGVVKGTTREQRQDQFNELLKRHAMNMDWRPTPKTDFALQATSYMQILTSPASWFINATQPLVVSAPVIAGRHGMARSVSEMTRAYREIMVPLAKAAKAGRIDDKVLLSLVPADVRENVRALVDLGRISSDSNFDLKEWQSVSDPHRLTRINNRIKDVMGDVELLNRLVTATAAVRLENAKGNRAGATEYASNIIYQTHGDYSGFNAPAVMRTPIGRILGQFRKFQLIQLGMYGRLVKDAFAHADPTERWVARKALAYSFGSMGLWGGTLGLPAAGIVASLLGAIFGDDDEPNNPEMVMRQWVGDADMADLLLRGVPAYLGVNLSERVGAGTLGQPIPFGKMALDRKSMTENVAAAMGPFVGTSINFLDGLSKIAQGDAMKGTAQMLPKGAANAIKGVDMMTRGLRQPNGDMAISAEEFGVLDGVLTGLGLPTTKSSDRQLRTSAKYEMDTFYKDRTSALKREYVSAYKEGDAQALQAARQEWTEMQTARKAHGYKIDPLSTLIKAPAEQRKREASTVGGVQYRRRDEGAVRQLAQMY